jgi:hypothetical protein
MKALLSLAAVALVLAPTAGQALPLCRNVDQLEANVILDRAEALLSRTEPGDTGSTAYMVWAADRDSQMSWLEMQLKLIATKAGCQLILEYRPSKAFAF